VNETEERERLIAELKTACRDHRGDPLGDDSDLRFPVGVHQAKRLIKALEMCGEALTVLQRRCEFYVEDLGIAKDNFLTIRDWAGAGRVMFIDNLAADSAVSIARRLQGIAEYGNRPPETIGQRENNER
jgi:hypothetical protein